MDINERFEAIIQTLYGGNKRAFAKAVCVSPTVIENVVGSRRGKPSYDVLYKVCANANISAEWLLCGKGDMMTKSTESINIKVMGPNEPQPDPYKTTQFNSDNQMSEVISVLSAQIVAKDETIRNLREELERVRPASGNRGQSGGENSFNQVLSASGDSDARYAGMVSDDHHWEEAGTIAAEP